MLQAAYLPKERLIRVLHDKANQRFAIHDVETGELLHVWNPPRTSGPMGPRPIAELETEAVRDFLVNGYHDDEGDDEPGW